MSTLKLRLTVTQNGPCELLRLKVEILHFMFITVIHEHSHLCGSLIYLSVCLFVSVGLWPSVPDE